MAEIIGFLRENATYGEHVTLKLLKQNLPKEFTVYVETPVYKKREIRYPDFIILANYGLIVLEVKDWVTITKITPHTCEVITRQNEVRTETNPVFTARDLAIDLKNELKDRMENREEAGNIPWGHAAVLINLPPSLITQLRRPWGEEYVLGKSDLENPDILLSRCKNLMPAWRLGQLTGKVLDDVRATIYPVLEIELPGKPPFVLDEQQERLVSEEIRVAPKEVAPQPTEPQAQQEVLFVEPQPQEVKPDLPPQGEQLSQNTAIRLVRGFSGSGKTLVLIQRARLLAAEYHEWKIAVLTFNKPLQTQLSEALKGERNVQVRTFHNLCESILSINPSQQHIQDHFEEWLQKTRPNFPILMRLGKEYVKEEINWLREIGLPSRAEYLIMDRKGKGQARRLTDEDRAGIYDVLEAYRQFLREKKSFDWEELPLQATALLEEQPGLGRKYNAILIDEAQDWAPAWFSVINRLVKADSGSIFLADDPSQSIYRHFSWKEKGIPVVGRTRWLRVPYRNTYQIYRAAYAMIADNPEIQQSLAEEGERVTPEIRAETMRQGPLPLIKYYRNTTEELNDLPNLVHSLRSEGIPEGQIAVLSHGRKDYYKLLKALKGLQVNLETIQRFKGLETEAVIIPQLEFTFQDPAEEVSEFRLMYMAMTRARQNLVMTYSGRLPRQYDILRTNSLVDIV
ncbi:MAG TPA: UvrD-helicase domain-containing protein [Anaerolineaceae bacterium]|nr:UvrD-helicase domain-containing protein [Anaerolineaceae bacterium]